jgi:hypothetical protein
MDAPKPPKWFIAQHAPPPLPLLLLKRFTTCQNTYHHGQSGPACSKYHHTNLKELITVVIPFLKKYSVYSPRKLEMDTLFFVCEQSIPS